MADPTEPSMPLVRIARQILKCDTAGCGHVEEVADISAELVGRPCPRCSANLLTVSDFAAWRRIHAGLFAAAAAAAEMVAEGLIPPPSEDHSTEVLVHHHDGTTTFTMKEPTHG